MRSTEPKRPTAAEIRDVLLRSARLAGQRTLWIRGCDVQAAIEGRLPDDYRPAGSGAGPSEGASDR